MKTIINRNINDIATFDLQRSAIRQEIDRSNTYLLHSANKLKQVDLKKMNLNFGKSAWQSDIEAMGDMRQKFLPRMAGKLLNATVLRKKGFFQRMILSAAARFGVKKLLNQQYKIPSAMRQKKSSDFINIVENEQMNIVK
ncbi:hypothetical protein EV200_104501 [Pedobacter psychrotolerans]|uniref:Uncharacterized protein n=1 Tax=Pedobacter psychrotolerans TaxID=1843235 RepID=A0A4R2HEM3_9SPHI|nr:hypothetical protein [Pedobacter psychrotolerans]TCO25463.1 hypothetical protein EV200_104501 [Pedobacter psychrotolerans]GGE45244.1 hypothetical protein GCM10011413_09240 [Pedobacter psychrotolerans]